MHPCAKTTGEPLSKRGYRLGSDGANILSGTTRPSKAESYLQIRAIRKRGLADTRRLFGIREINKPRGDSGNSTLRLNAATEHTGPAPFGGAVQYMGWICDGNTLWGYAGDNTLHRKTHKKRFSGLRFVTMTVFLYRKKNTLLKQ